MLGAMAAAKDLPFAFDPVSNDLRAAMFAGWSKHVYCALKAVEDVLVTSMSRYREGLVVRVAAIFALSHVGLCSFQMVEYRLIPLYRRQPLILVLSYSQT